MKSCQRVILELVKDPTDKNFLLNSIKGEEINIPYIADSFSLIFIQY